ncbi:MAG: hypothetical protein MUD17_12940 [Gemmatimonadaceae bacterium]|nr:hypothetical protein [Gemmatimonadaceae bacterium]
MRPLLLGVALLIGGVTHARAVAPAPPDATRRTLPASDSLPPGFRAAFDANDARARAITYWLQCVPTIARLRADGRFGVAATAPRLIHCERLPSGEPIGGVFDVDSSFTRVSRLQLVRLDGDRGAFTDAIDTLRLAHEAHLVRDVTAALAADVRRTGRPFSAIPVARVGATSEVWAMPRANRVRMVVTGGERAYVRAPDGSLRLLVDRSASWAQLPLPPDGPLELTSAADTVPGVGDLAPARYQAEFGRLVTVRTRVVESRLVPGLDPATGARVVWEHTAARR